MSSYAYGNNQRVQPQFGISSSLGQEQNYNISYCEFMQKNKPQSNSIAGGLLIIAAGGYHIAWLLWNVSWSQSGNATFFTQFAGWHFGIIIGSVAGAMLVPSWQKKNIYYLCGVLSIFGSTLFVIWQVMYLTAFGRLIAGFAHGIVYVTTITHGAENVIKEMRGRLISSVQFLMYSSALTFTILNLYGNTYTGLELIVGIMPIIFALMGLAFTPCLTYESITYLLYRNNEQQALQDTIKLRTESFATSSISKDLQEMKAMVLEDILKDRNIMTDNNLRPLILMISLSFIVTLSSNFILNNNLIQLTSEVFVDQSLDEDPKAIAAIILIIFRYIAGLVMLLCGDLFSRKKCLTISSGLAAASVLLLPILSMYARGGGLTWIMVILSIAFQVFVGGGVEPMQHVLLSEAFSTAKKYWSIAVIVIFQSLIQIAVVGISFIDNDTIVNEYFLYASTACVMIMTVVLHLKLPDTRGMSLKQGRDAFVKQEHLGN